MASSTTPSTVTPSSIFDSKPRGGLSNRTIIIIASVLSASLVFVITIAVVHVVRKRWRSKSQAMREADIEASLQCARPPVLTIDTNLPRTHELQRSTRDPPVMNMDFEGQISQVPSISIQTPSLPPIMQHVPLTPLPMCTMSTQNSRVGRSATRHATRPPGVAGRSPTRSASQPPGIGGRGAGHIRRKAYGQ
ncbi:hypothetical protein T440DRAFT_479910 [Plenodomus tracheiphilus IPT5]|uniref:Uncharacterized protein n=1 Tax=Plenodomus tracheiphilus IPT5 TaxID=1408161 RepID=A0A6A7B2N3_9PLEO|nr:hypothetical protein T440DRAFT_479910 [Plenodomus tracheiphilus IPT5]